MSSVSKTSTRKANNNKRKAASTKKSKSKVSTATATKKTSKKRVKATHRNNSNNNNNASNDNDEIEEKLAEIGQEAIAEARSYLESLEKQEDDPYDKMARMSKDELKILYDYLCDLHPVSNMAQRKLTKNYTKKEILLNLWSVNLRYYMYCGSCTECRQKGRRYKRQPVNWFCADFIQRFPFLAIE